MSSRTERITKQQRQDAMAGIDAAQAALRALADGDEDRVLAVVNTADVGQLRFLTRTCLSMVWQSMLLLCDHDHDKARRALRGGADGLDGDRAVLEAALILTSAEGGTSWR